ncbi:aldose epimerase family protein [Synoicihabitans lomoniglobus]|uniref:Aldose 1-epimerase n=1 Tax=Synoicihabitans lomoniglobus TaxID=2909285 RepID=A0AAF0A123_9BACT|nr:galactose mutarotase [Opitutaceae bacterium LMO-M01]WED65383.1 galactose mutarotase [Opitutaceae bacterium LMO-M01]
MSTPSSAPSGASVTRQPYGRTADGQDVELFILTNASGMRVDVITYGATIVRLFTPDRDGRSADVVLGYDTLAGYEAGSCFFGATIGRFGNRIAGGRFTLNGETYELPINQVVEGRPCQLHGGPEGFHRQIWKATPRTGDGVAAVEMKHFSPDGHMGYPGNVSVTVIYRLLADNTLEVEFAGETDAPTPLNLTQHTYFNLGGPAAKPIVDHMVQIAAARYLAVDAGLIPEGPPAPVAATPFDFTAPHAVGERINEPGDQLARGEGYDHCWALDGVGGEMHPCAVAHDPASGRRLEVTTTEPGVQFYTGNHLPPEGEPGKSGVRYLPRTGFCLETQRFPDSPNRPDFPDTVALPGKPWRSRTRFKFTADE